MKDKKIIELCSYLFVVVMILYGCSSKSKFTDKETQLNAASEDAGLDEKNNIESSNKHIIYEIEYRLSDSVYDFEEYYHLLFIPGGPKTGIDGDGVNAIVYYNPEISDKIILIDGHCSRLRSDLFIEGNKVYYIKDIWDLWSFQLDDFEKAKPMSEKLLPEEKIKFISIIGYESTWIVFNVQIESKENQYEHAKYYLKDDGSKFKIEYDEEEVPLEEDKGVSVEDFPKELTIEEMGNPILAEADEYITYTGHWIPNNLDYDIMSETGGIELEIEISSSGIITGVFSTSTWKRGHIAEAVFEGEIENNIGVVTFNNDNWDHYGTITFEFYEKGIKATVEIDGIHGGIEHGYRIGYGSVNFSKRVDEN